MSNDLQIAKAGIRLHNIWGRMQERCNNPGCRTYHRYGGRGIKIRWADFDSFFEDMFPTHDFSLSLDRINNDGDYCRENCRWATPKQQANNTSKNRWIEIDGERKTLVEWAEYFGMRPGTVTQRINSYGWDEIRAITTPIAPRNAGHCTNGHPFTEETKRKDGKGYWCKECRRVKGVAA